MSMLLIIVIGLALAFGFINGFHDTANASATVVTTKTLSPRMAVVMAAVLNGVGALVTTGVARTMARGIAHEDALTLPVLLAGLLAATVWNLGTWYLGIPSSSSHALVGGVAGAAVLGGGFAALNMSGLAKIVVSLLLSPLVGLGAGLGLAWAARRLKPSLERLHVLSAAVVALGHGSNDAQKAMGMMTAALVAAGWVERVRVPWWVVGAAAAALAAGTALGGWRVTRTMGQKIVKLTPRDGFAAESASALVVLVATGLKLPVSTTHVISAAIVATGIRKGEGAVNWAVMREITSAMLLTIPASAVLGALVGWFINKMI